MKPGELLRVRVAFGALGAVPVFLAGWLGWVQVAQGATLGHDLPAPLRDGRVLSAVWHVAPCSPTTGTPGGYRLRFLLDPARQGRDFAAPEPHLQAN